MATSTIPAETHQYTTDQTSLSSLHHTTIPTPSPGPDQVLVHISALSLNYRDTEVLMGLYTHHASTGPPAPIVPCSDICGTIALSNSPKWKVGQRVMGIFNQSHLTGQVKAEDMRSGLGLPLSGCLTEYRVFPAEGLVAVPGYLTEEEASCLPIAFVTAWMGLNGFRGLGQPWRECKGEVSLLVQGTGGVSVAGLLLGKAAGMRVIVTSSSEEKLKRAKELGADVGINYKENPEWQEEVLRVTGGEGVDLIFDNGGTETLPRSFECVKFGGLINCIGYLSGKGESKGGLGTSVLALKRNVTVKGILNGPRERFEEMVQFMGEEGVRPVVDRVFGFGEAREAFEYLWSGGHFGKVVVKME